MENKLDLKDRKLIYELDLNARQSFNMLGRKVGLNKNTVQYRVARLQKEGVIKRFYALIDTSKLGYSIFRVYLRFQNLTEEKETKIINYLMQHPKVGWIVSVEGNWDLDFMIWVKNHFEFDEFWQEFKFKFEEQIQNRWTSLFVRLNFYARPYLINLKRDESKPLILYDQPKKEIEFDNNDILILKIISEDSRVGVLEIAGKVKLSVNSVKSRIKKLQGNGIIKAYKPMLDLEKIGYKYYKFHAKLKNVNGNDWKIIKSFCQQHQNILNLNELINGADLELDVQVKDDTELRRFISEIRAKFQDYIVDYEILHYYKEHKFVFFPVD